MADVLIQNATVITVDQNRRVFENGAVAISGDAIVAVGPSPEVLAVHRAPKVIDGRHRIVMPGMADLYAHSGCGMLKSLGDQLAGVGWWHLMDNIHLTYVTPRWWYVDSQLHAAERLRYGCSAILSQPGLSHARLDVPDHILETARAFEDLGIRAGVIAGVPRSSPWQSRYADLVNGRRVLKEVSPEQVMATLEQVVADAYRHPSALVNFWVGTFLIGNPTLIDSEHPSNPFHSDQDIGYYLKQAERLQEIMKRYDTGYWAHCWGDGVTHAYDDGFRELLGPRTLLSHCTRLDDRSIEILAETKTNVNHCPRARRLQMWHETCRVVEMLEAGVNVGLGSDAPQLDRNCDPFMDMQMAIRVQRRRFSDPGVLPVGTVLELSTTNGYRALGLGSIGGSIEVGKKADVVIIDARQPHLSPLTMPVHQLVYFGAGADVEHVFVNGRHVVDRGRITTINVDDLLDEADEEMERLMSYPELNLRQLVGSPENIWRSPRISQTPLQTS
jgi:cytosine/adenosine deaminase-related metal-dependent hydrolase